MKKIWIIVFLGLVVYSFGLFNGFVWDDEEQIVNNVFVHSIKNIPILFQSSTFNNGGAGLSGGTYYRPLMMTFFSFVYNIFGPNPFFFHFFQLVFHILTAILIYYLFNHFFKEGISFFLALIFLVHPGNVETVAYISAIQDIFYVFFGLLALYLIIKDRGKFEFKKIILINSLLLLALLSKETGILFFLLILIYKFIYQKKYLLEHIIFFMITIGIYSILRFAIGGVFFTPYHNAPIVQLNFWQRTMMIPALLFHYLKLFFYPVNLDVMQHWVIRTFSFYNFYWPLLVIIGFFLLSIFKSSIFFFLWFIISIAPYLQLFPLDMTVADRWFYLPMIGLLGMIGTMLSKLQIINHKSQINFKSQIKSKTIFILLIIIIIVFSVRSFIRILDWKNGLTLYSRDVKISKDAFDLENNLGVELFRSGKYTDAKNHFKNSTEIAPFWWTNWNNLGVIYEREKNIQKAAEYYQKAIDNGQYYLAYENLAKILVIHGKDQKKTKEFLQNSLYLFPKSQNLLLINNYFIEKNNQK